MFDLEITEDNSSINEPVLKKIKVDSCLDYKPIHSALSYNSIEAPPFIEYNSVESYCEQSRGKTFGSQNFTDSTYPGLNNLLKVSSPIVLRDDKDSTIKSYSMRCSVYEFFSIEELSLVQSLKNWANTKVCAVGITSFDSSTQQCYLNSVMEEGSWNILLDSSLLLQIPPIQTTLQIFGSLQIRESKSYVQMNFFRAVNATDMPLLVESYKLMQKYVTKYNVPSESNGVLTNMTQKERTEKSNLELNDTLDNFDFSRLDYEIKVESKNSIN